jgi:hypothetical protein
MRWKRSIWFIILIAAPRFGRPEELAGNWPKNGGNHFNQNYSALTAINRENVGRLKAVWRARLDGSGAGARYSGSAQGHEGPALSGARNVASIARIVQQGGTQMPSLSSSLTARDIQDVSAYVRERLVH